MFPSRQSRAWQVALAVLALCWSAGCGLLGARLPSQVLTTAGDQPALFLGPGQDAATIGYLSPDVPLTVTGRAREGRVPVRVDGNLRTRGWVDERLLALRVQRRGRVRGTPVYVGPDDVLAVRSRAGTRQRVGVRAQARLSSQPLGPAYEGSYPREGLAATRAPQDALAPEPGRAYLVPAGRVLPLHEAPRGPVSAELPARDAAYAVRVVNAHEGWLAVRAGDGPFLIGWTQLPLQPLAMEATPLGAAQPAAQGTLPARLVDEPGALKRVVAGAKVIFAEEVIGVFKQAGYARVLKAYDQAGYADVFVASDDDVALRGLVRAIDLQDVAPPPAR